MKLYTVQLGFGINQDVKMEEGTCFIVFEKTDDAMSFIQKMPIYNDQEIKLTKINE